MQRVRDAYARSAKRFADPDEPKRYKWHGYTRAECDAIWDGVASLVPADARVLELGCGGGQLAERLLRQQGHSFADRYIGIDILEGNVAVARQRVPSLRFEPGNMWEVLAGQQAETEGVAWDFVVSVGCAFSHTDFAGGSGARSRVESGELLFDLIERSCARGFAIVCASGGKTGIPSSLVVDYMSRVKRRSCGTTLAYFDGPRGFLNGVFRFPTRVIVVLRKGRCCDPADQQAPLPAPLPRRLCLDPPVQRFHSAPKKDSAKATVTRSGKPLLVVLMERLAWRPHHRHPPMPFADLFCESVRRVGLEPVVVLHPKQFYNTVCDLQAQSGDQLWGVLLMQCPIGDSYAIERDMSMATMLGWLRGLEANGVRVLPSLSIIELVNSKRYTTELDESLSLSGTTVVTGASRDCTVLKRVDAALKALSGAGVSRAWIKRGWSYEAYNVSEVKLPLPLPPSDESEHARDALAATRGVIQGINRTRNWKCEVDLGDLEDDSTVTIVQPFNPALQSRLNEYRCFFLFNSGFVGFFVFGGKHPSVVFDPSNERHRQALDTAERVMRGFFLPWCASRGGGTLPPVVRVDVTFSPEGVEAGRFSSVGANGKYPEGLGAAFHWYCNEIEIMPSFYFDLPIGGGQPSKCNRMEDYQRCVANAFGDYLDSIFTR